MRHSLLRSAISVAGIVAIVGLAAGVAAKPGRGHHDRSDRLERKLERLDLSAETRASALAIIDQARPVERELREQAREAKQALHALLEADPADEARVMAQADEVGIRMTAVRKHDLRTWLAVRAVLSPEERAELARMKGRHGREGR